MIEEIFGVILVAKRDAKKEEKIDTYLEVKHAAKQDAKVVEKMDAILDVNLDANMVILRMKLWC